MGKILIIKGADFSENAIVGVSYIPLPIEQGGINIISGSNFGNYSTASTTNVKRLRVPKTSLIYFEEGDVITFRGLSGISGAVNNPLRFDACIYSSQENPAHATAITSISLSWETDAFPCNVDGNDEYILTAPATGWYGFNFAGENIDNPITVSDYDDVIRYKNEE